ncbi:tautomerase family protein [Lichenihabitans sp. PAMC28606]|uniref:tautomerase family protein n=1 Tax=Lichenihabitans sp. PAMC28606 TaxID=2880932 RepID=UPI001D0A7701|nr:tautomerase family protein [Lichenihabitans sp. PAMC28606]UDL94069.1 tautomerase family protein [Lichenihabitans sp. PAMC28606]
MPMVYIQMHEGKGAAYKKAVSDGIHVAMMDVLGVPDDTWDQFFNEHMPGNMVYDANYFGVHRSPDMIFIHFFFNTRPKEMKERFFERVADELTKHAGLRREDLLMAITEVPWENWWAYGRTIDPKTGFDTRM